MASRSQSRSRREAWLLVTLLTLVNFGVGASVEAAACAQGTCLVEGGMTVCDRSVQTCPPCVYKIPGDYSCYFKVNGACPFPYTFAVCSTTPTTSPPLPTTTATPRTPTPTTTAPRATAEPPTTSSTATASRTPATAPATASTPAAFNNAASIAPATVAPPTVLPSHSSETNASTTESPTAVSASTTGSAPSAGSSSISKTAGQSPGGSSAAIAAKDGNSLVQKPHSLALSIVVISAAVIAVVGVTMFVIHRLRMDRGGGAASPDEFDKGYAEEDKIPVLSKRDSSLPTLSQPAQLGNRIDFSKLGTTRAPPNPAEPSFKGNNSEYMTPSTLEFGATVVTAPPRNSRSTSGFSRPTRPRSTGRGQSGHTTNSGLASECIDEDSEISFSMSSMPSSVPSTVLSMKASVRGVKSSLIRREFPELAGTSRPTVIEGNGKTGVKSSLIQRQFPELAGSFRSDDDEFDIVEPGVLGKIRSTRDTEHLVAEHHFLACSGISSTSSSSTGLDDNEHDNEHEL